jgi:hypothetical protein
MITIDARWLHQVVVMGQVWLHLIAMMGKWQLATTMDRN